MQPRAAWCACHVTTRHAETYPILLRVFEPQGNLASAETIIEFDDRWGLNFPTSMEVYLAAAFIARFYRVYVNERVSDDSADSRFSSGNVFSRGWRWLSSRSVRWLIVACRPNSLNEAVFRKGGPRRARIEKSRAHTHEIPPPSRYSQGRCFFSLFSPLG